MRHRPGPSIRYYSPLTGDSRSARAADAPETTSVEYEALETDLGEVGVLAENLEAPWSIAFHGETPLISERATARILEMDADGETHEVGMAEQAASSPGEGGLLGIAIHENQLYAYLTTGPNNQVIRYDLTGEPGSYKLSPAQELFIGIPAAGYHNGGRIALGSDDMLYLTTGDALEPSRSQDLDSLTDKILSSGRHT